MRNMFKKVISLLLAIMMVLSLFTIVPLTTSAEETTAPVVTAKALYKSHKIEWSSTGKEETSAFTITNNASITATPSITYVDVNNIRYYTALLNVGTGKNAGAIYTVKKGETIIGTATVTEKTGEAALFHNAIVAENYGADGKNFAGTDKNQMINLTASDPVKKAKLQNLTGGSIIVGANTDDNGKVQCILGSEDKKASLKIKTGGVISTVVNCYNNNNNTYTTDAEYAYNGNNVQNGENFVVNMTVYTNYRTWIGIQRNNTDKTYNVGFWTRNSNDKLVRMFKSLLTSDLYIGGQNYTSGLQLFDGTIYYVIISEESLGSNASDAGDPASFRTVTQNNIPGSASKITSSVTLQQNENNNILTWYADKNDKAHYQILNNGIEIIPTNFTVTQDSDKYLYTATVPKSNSCEYTVKNYLSNALVKVMTAKALYKNHKIEWFDSTTTSKDNFTIKVGDTTISNATITDIDVNGIRYYTALVPVNTGTGAGTTYTVARNDNTTIGTATVTENTGREALIKNSIVSVDYRSTEKGYKSITGANDVEKLDVSAVTLAKLKTLKSGAMVVAVSRTGNATTDYPAALSLGSNSDAPYIGGRAASANTYGFRYNQTWAGGGMGNIDENVQSVFAVSVLFQGGCYIYRNGAVAYGNWESKQTSQAFIDTTGTTGNKGTLSGNIDGVYVGGAGTNNVFTNSNIYFAVVSEEELNGADLANITKTEQSILQTTIAKAQPYIDNINVKNDANYRKLKSDLATYSTYGISTSVKDCFKAITILENNISALNFRDTYNGSVVAPIDKDLLKKNATDNNHAQGSEVKDSKGTIISYNDGDATQLFDNNLDSKWHSNYDKKIGKGSTENVGESNIVWMQTGFDGATRYITGIECTPRTDLIDQIKTYKVYVSNSATAPNVDTSADGSSEWKLVKEGEFTTACQKVGETQFISLDGKHEAKWVRLVVTSVYERDYGAHFLAIAEMDIYEAVNETPIDIQLLNKNATDNNHAQGSLENGVYKDGDAKQVFDGKVETLWHSNYDSKGGGVPPVTENSPAWLQTGFGDTMYITKLECTPRDGFGNQMKKYAVYVSTSDTKPDINTSAENSTDWTLVKSGTLTQCSANGQTKHVISFQPVEAKWVRLVVYTVYNEKNLLAISEMDIYKVDNANIAISRYANEIENKLVEAEQILARENLCINDAYNNLVTICQNYKTYDLAAHDSANDLKYIQDNIDAISIALSSNETAVDKTLLANNADANSWVEDWHNHDAKALFDGNNIDCWHSRYGADNNGKTKKGSAFTEGGNVWIQTGFGGEISKSITKITVTPRGDINADNIYNGSGQVKDYKIYVSNANSKPDIDTNVTATNSGWIFVKEGSFVYNATATQSIQFEKPVEAKWIRLVILTTSDNATKNSSHASIGEMEIYEIDSCTHKAEVISNDIKNQVNEAKKLILKAGIDATELNKQIAELSNYNELLKTCDATQLQEKLTAISQKITTSGENEKAFNKDTENLNSFANDSVKWNNTEERLQTLRNNANASVTEGDKKVTYIFDGKYHIDENETAEYYGSWVSGASTPAEITTGFGETVCVSGIVVFDRKNNNSSQNPLNSYKVLVSNDADFSSCLVAAEGSRNGNTNYSASGYVIKFDRPYNCKYIKVISTDNTLPADIKIVEMDIYEYVGKSEEVELVVTSVAENCTDINVADKIGKALTLNRKYSDKFTQDEVNEQLLSQGISLNDLAHNYTISVNDSGNIEVAVNKARYTLDVYNNGSRVYTQTEDYNGVFEKQIEGCTAWRIGDSKTGSIICTGDTFNYRATGDITVYVETSTEAPQISVYIPEPLVSYNNSETVVEIPVYIIGTRNLVEKGIVFVMGNTGTVTTEDINKYILKEKFNDNIYSFSSKVGLTNRGRYIQKLNTSGKWPNGTFYGYIITKDANNNNIVTLSQAREYSGI